MKEGDKERQRNRGIETENVSGEKNGERERQKKRERREGKRGARETEADRENRG